MLSKPRLPMPAPLRGADRGSFAEDTVKRRLPNIARRVLRDNELSATAVAAVETLLAEIPYALIRPLTDTHAPDTAVWQPAIDRYRSQNWLQVPWFFAETYFFRRLIEAVDYFHTGLDPYRRQKEEALTMALTAANFPAHELVTGQNMEWREDTFRRLLLAALWGNQVDLSLWATDAAEKPDHADEAAWLAHLLVDDSPAVISHLHTLLEARLDILVDNAGPELLADLMLADYLLVGGKAGQVHLHLKMHPTFVSDATPDDVSHTLIRLCAEPTEAMRFLGERLVKAQADGRLQTHTHPFLTSPYPFWHMPDDLRRTLAAADLIICKGDAQYRRALGDAHWPVTTPLANVVCYFPAPVLFLRVCKSDPLVGLPADQLQHMQQLNENWQTNGRWGVIQLA